MTKYRTDSRLDANWHDLLKLLGCQAHPNLFLLGCFARHVTFYSQQIRAYNLVDALCNTGRLTSGDAIAVVGAGLAGLSTTAAALARGLKVHLFERNNSPGTDIGKMPLQVDTQKRWIDPFIYDWPFTPHRGATQDSDKIFAAVPYLDWHADTADNVRAQIIEGFNRIVNANASRFSAYHQDVTEADFDLTDRHCIKVAVRRNATKAVVRCAVLAIGFGVETEPSWRYWTDDGLSSDEANGKRYLISGYGDGALTDAMRLTIANFKHRDVIAAFQAQKPELANLIDKISAAGADDSMSFVAAAMELAQRAPLLEDRLPRRNTDVLLTGSPNRVFNGSSSILNRLIIAWLLHESRLSLLDCRINEQDIRRNTPQLPQFIRWDSNHRIVRPQAWSLESGKFVPRPYRKKAQFDQIIVRHGPGRRISDKNGNVTRVRPIDDFPRIASSVVSRAWWQSTPHWNDWTRVPTWSERVTASNALRLDPPRADQNKIVVLAGHEHVGRLARIVQGIQRDIFRDGDAFSMELDRAFTSPAHIAQAVRVVATSHVAIVDLTELTPEVMFLLGVRAAMRRGVTILIRRIDKSLPELDPSESPFLVVDDLPYLIRDVAILAWRQEHAFTRLLKRSVEEGWGRYSRLRSHYSDLGVYDEVRNLGSDREDYNAVPPERATLLLAPFDVSYRQENASWLKARAERAKLGPLRYVVEAPSPDLIRLKLYSSIRRSTACIVDLTNARPNVFFEMGVRAAVSPYPCICIGAAGQDQAPLSAAKAIFGAREYDVRGSADDDRQFETYLRECVAALGSNNDEFPGWPQTPALLSPNGVYRQIRGVKNSSSEEWSEPVWEHLVREADRISGVDPQADAMMPVLFAEAGNADAAALQRLIAAWLYMDSHFGFRDQIKDGSFSADEPQSRDWMALGLRLEPRLRFAGETFQKIFELIEAINSRLATRKGTKNGRRSVR